MATLVFEDDGIEEEFPAGRLLQEAIEDFGADIIFGCREGGCATCIVRIVEGMEHLSPITHAEQSTLEDAELEGGLRLACQITVVGDGRIVIQAAGL